MFKYKSVTQQLVEERKKNEALRANQQHSDADIEYIAMMCDVELETDGEEVSENE